VASADREPTGGFSRWLAIGVRHPAMSRCARRDPAARGQYP
jgi:hypothetical protein